jgi:type I restriction enzyme, S subunit
MSDWRDLRLDEIGTVERGRSRHRPRNDPSLYGGPYPFVQTGDIKSAGLHLFQYSQTYNEKGLAQSRLWPAGTLCFTIAANIGDTAILGIPACFPDSIVGFTPFPNSADVVFVKYALEHAKLRFSAISKGATQDNLSLEKLLSQPLAIPSLKTQQRIASILGAYDDLIEVNRRRVAVLEEMARGLFEEWFVRFRFPGHETVPILHTPDGPLPEGWRWGKFSDFAIEVRSSVSPDDLPADTPYVGLEHLPRRSTTLDQHGAAGDVSSMKLAFQKGDILFGKIRPYFHKVVWSPLDGVCSTDAIVWRPIDGFAAQALAIASSDAFVAHSVQTSNGTKMPRANPGVLAAYKCPIAPAGIRTAYEEAVKPLAELAAVLQHSNQRLASSRDLLLPRLISGELSVASAERELEEVV